MLPLLFGRTVAKYELFMKKLGKYVVGKFEIFWVESISNM